MRALLPLLAALAFAAAPAEAGQVRPFDARTFAALQAHDAPMIVFVHAPWCPICRAQQQTINKLIATPEYHRITVLTIDFDSQKPLWSKFGAKQQSTLIAFHGRRETARLAYDSDPQKVTDVVAASLR
jgi:thioredoxin 1